MHNISFHPVLSMLHTCARLTLVDRLFLTPAWKNHIRPAVELQLNRHRISRSTWKVPSWLWLAWLTYRLELRLERSIILSYRSCWVHSISSDLMPQYSCLSNESYLYTYTQSQFWCHTPLTKRQMQWLLKTPTRPLATYGQQTKQSRKAEN